MNVFLDLAPMSGAWSKSFATLGSTGTPEDKQNNSSGLISELKGLVKPISQTSE